MRVSTALVLTIGLASPLHAVAQEVSAPPVVRALHLGSRCADHAVADEAWSVIYAALAAPGHSSMDPVLADLQDSVAQVLKVEPAAVDTRFLLASLMGARSEVNGGRTKLEWAGAMEVEARRILDRNPDHPGARHLIGRLHAAVQRMSGFKRFLARSVFGADVLGQGSWETARAHLEAAEAGTPCVPDHHYELARLYQDVGLWAEAEREIRHTLEIAVLRPEYSAVRLKAMALGTGPL